jgi:formylglycine-generating enzyme required for sulfatase activity
MAQGGNMGEWTESEYDHVNDSSSSNRLKRGGAWAQGLSPMQANVGGPLSPTAENISNGFRVAELPEPSTVTLFVLGAIGVWFASRRRKMNH